MITWTNNPDDDPDAGLCGPWCADDFDDQDPAAWLVLGEQAKAWADAQHLLPRSVTAGQYASLCMGYRDQWLQEHPDHWMTHASVEQLESALDLMQFANDVPAVADAVFGSGESS